MREDQVKRLQDLSEQLADAFIGEADPTEWPGNGQAPADLTQQERGDRYWCKKNAMATGGVLRYTLDLIDKHGGQNPDEGMQSADLENRIKDAEKRAAAATQRALEGARKKAFDARAVGKG
jgi:hypothetical protein